MKYIKTFEEEYSTFYTPAETEKLSEYTGKILINVPSQTYFKSVIRFQIIFVDEVFKHKLIFKDDWGEYKFEYQVLADDVIRCNSDDALSYNNSWDQAYNQDDFDRLDFITVEEFYNQHTDVFVELLEGAIRESKEPKYTEMHKYRVNRIIGKMTIPATEHIVTANTYNL